MSHSETVQALYAAFGREDVDTILSMLADDVQWDNSRVASSECPWNGNFTGKANVPGFFEAVGANLEFSVFDPHTFIESGKNVAVCLRMEAKVRKNGAKFANNAIHLWTLNDAGNVTAYQHYNDTAMELAAWRS